MRPIIAIESTSGEAMDLFKTKIRRKILFASLYLSEGAPIGFIWLALPTRLRERDVPIEQITWLAAILVLPWTFKFAWAPLIDWLRNSHWTLRHWVVSAQIMMGITLVPLLWIDPKYQFSWLAISLLLHAFAAATQDVAIDALCISSTAPGERGEYNGWMQTGMMLGRAMMGGGALVLASYVGDRMVVGLLIGLTTYSMVLVIMSRPPDESAAGLDGQGRRTELLTTIGAAMKDRNTWIGLAFAVIGGASFKSLEVIYGPYLVDRGISQELIGWFSLGPMIGAMIVGALIGGFLTDRFGARKCVVVSMVYISTLISVMAMGDSSQTVAARPAQAKPSNSEEPQLGAGRVSGEPNASHGFAAREPTSLQQADSSKWFLLSCLTMTALGIGAFTTASYALFMDISRPAIAATQFSAFMGATNGCESWSSFASGKLIASHGYPTSMLAMSLISLLAIPLLAWIRPRRVGGESVISAGKTPLDSK